MDSDTEFWASEMRKDIETAMAEHEKRLRRWHLVEDIATALAMGTFLCALCLWLVLTA